MRAVSRTERLKRMLNPRSAVFVGGTVIVEAVDYCRDMGFAGPIHVVNPFHGELAGLPCHESVADLPEVPDIAYIGAPRSAVVDTLAALSRAGAAGAVCNSAGFSELQGDGVDLQNAFVAAAGDMPVLGPNCPGFANFADNAAFMQGYFGDHRSVERGVAVISNGGAYISDMGCAERSLPIAFQAGLGNQAIVTMADIMDLVLDDDRVLAVNLYFEGLCDVAGLSACALKAARRGIPVVAVKGGRHSAGRRAAQTHTASLAGDDVAASALFRRFGFVEAGNAIEVIETLKFLVFAGVPKGSRTAFTTSSGSYAVLGGDAAEHDGLVIPGLGEATHAALRELLPSYILPSNPLDISNGQYFEQERLEAIYGTYLDEGFDIALQVMCFPPPGGWNPETWYRNADAYARQARERSLPCAFIATLPEGLPLRARQAMIANGMAPLMGIDHGIKAAANAVRYAGLARGLAARSDGEVLLSDCPPVDEREQPRLNEAQAKQLLAGLGVATPASVVLSPDDRGDSGHLTFPIVVKALSPELLHKTESGAVALGINDHEQAARALARIRAGIDQDQPDLLLEGFLLEEMVAGGVCELMIGIRRVPGIGMILTLAAGGDAVELIRDAATVILPASRATLSGALRSLGLFPLLDGWRGRQAGDVDAVLDAVQAVCDFAVRNADGLVDLEINPLIVRPAGEGVVAADAVARLSRPVETLNM